MEEPRSDALLARLQASSEEYGAYDGKYVLFLNVIIGDKDTWELETNDGNGNMYLSIVSVVEKRHA